MSSLARSEIMARVRSRNTRPELILRSSLWSRGFRYRLNARIFDVRPDFVFPRQRVAVFVDGCFWHGCPAHYTRPVSRRDYWAGKLQQNVLRDVRQTQELEAAGWRTVRIWEHEVSSDLNAAVARVASAVAAAEWCPDSDWRTIAVRPASWLGDNHEQRILCALRNPARRRVVNGIRYSGRARPRNEI